VQRNALVVGADLIALFEGEPDEAIGPAGCGQGT
jgi:hypothetical protein